MMDITATQGFVGEEDKRRLGQRDITMEEQIRSDRYHQGWGEGGRGRAEGALSLFFTNCG
jgi:hypothetical protein